MVDMHLLHLMERRLWYCPNVGGDLDTRESQLRYPRQLLQKHDCIESRTAQYEAVRSLEGCPILVPLPVMCQLSLGST